jgi:hypothetical protein
MVPGPVAILVLTRNLLLLLFMDINQAIVFH